MPYGAGAPLLPMSLIYICTYVHIYVSIRMYIPFYQSQFPHYQIYQYVVQQDSSNLDQFVHL